MNTSASEIIYAIIAITGGLIIYQIFFISLKKWSHKKKWFIPSLLSKYIYYPGLILMCNLTAWIALSFLENHLSTRMDNTIRHTITISNIIFAGFFISRIITVMSKIGLHKYSEEDAINYSYRKAKTK